MEFFSFKGFPSAHFLIEKHCVLIENEDNRLHAAVER